MMSVQNSRFLEGRIRREADRRLKALSIFRLRTLLENDYPCFSSRNIWIMPDPVMLGALVAAALSMAGEATLKGGVGEAVKDAYKALREKVSHWAFNDVEALEQTPTSTTRQAVIAEIVDARPRDDQEPLLTETLVAAVKKHAPAMGLDISRLTAGRL
jgi:hypothetical protein